MRFSRRQLAAATTLILSAPSLLRADQPGAQADLASLPPGTHCRVVLVTESTAGGGTIDVTYEGKVIAATHAGLKLSVNATRRKHTSNAQAARIPILGRLFTNIGLSQAQPGSDTTLWLPAEKIQTVERLADSPSS